MKIKKKNKFLIVIFILICIFTLNTNIVHASSISGALQGADDFIDVGVNDTSPTIEVGNMQSMSDLLYNTLLVVAIIIAIIIGLVIAIQFITGSVSEKAKIKETLIPYFAGCVVIFGAFGIWKLVVNLLSSI